MKQITDQDTLDGQRQEIRTTLGNLALSSQRSRREN
jgi:hypothetical protein